MQLKERIGRVVCPLGVGEHFEYWGFNSDRIVELDWNESCGLSDGFRIHCLPARHFSGRGLQRNRSLWASFLVESPSRRVYLAGDGGYDAHFAEIGHRFAPIDLAVVENGQYNADWRYIHLMPEKLPDAIRDLRPARVLTVHHSKFALSRHAWDEPLKNAAEALIEPIKAFVASPRDERIETLDAFCGEMIEKVGILESRLPISSGRSE